MLSEGAEDLDHYLALVRVWAAGGVLTWRADIQEEAVQETVVKAFRLTQVGERHGKAYWAKTAYNKAVDLIRKERRRMGTPVEEPIVVPPEFMPADDDERPEALRVALAELTERQRRLLALNAEGLQLREVADEFGISVETVRGDLAGLRRRLRAAIEPAATGSLTLEAIGLGFLARREAMTRRLPAVAAECQRRYREHDRWADAYRQVSAGQLGPIGDRPDDAALVAAHLGWRLLATTKPRCWAREAAPAHVQPLRGQAESVWALCLVLALRAARHPAAAWLDLQGRVELRCALSQLEGITLDQLESIVRADERQPLPASLVAAAEAFAAHVCRVELFRC